LLLIVDLLFCCC
jgi:hypothetical protein